MIVLSFQRKLDMQYQGEFMAKSLFIAEKPSVAQEFVKAMKMNTNRRDGYVEGESAVFTWCVGHLVTMSYPEAYDEKLKRWSLDTLPFLPKTFLYEVIPAVKKQFEIVKGLLNRTDIDTIYVCTDSGREGEYIYRLVEQMAQVKGKVRKRVWIDSQTEEEILRGIEVAKDLKEYDNLSNAAYLRAKEDYLMGINFSRLLTLKYGRSIAGYLKQDRAVISVGRVMTCVLGMVVRREREIRQFVKTPFYRVIGNFSPKESGQSLSLDAEWKVSKDSKYAQEPQLYKENGFRIKEKAGELIRLFEADKEEFILADIEKKKEKKNPPLFFNLAELQNECSKLFKISPDETLRIAQELYEKKLVTYPRTDARVLSTAVAKVIDKNIRGLKNLGFAKEFAEEILNNHLYQGLAKTRYVNDKQITDHYAIIPTGQTAALSSLQGQAQKVYMLIVRRFLSVFYPPAVYQKVALVLSKEIKQGEKHYTETFTASFRMLAEEGYYKVSGIPSAKKKNEEEIGENSEPVSSEELLRTLQKWKKGAKLFLNQCEIKEGETSPPKRYNSGSIILAMENAGQLIEDEELRAQIKGSGIGTSATRAEILKKLVHIKYISLNKKTQVITPSQMGEMVFDVVNVSMRSLLNPELTASWEKGLTYVAEGTITTEEYMQKLEDFVRRRTQYVMQLNNQYQMRTLYDEAAIYYNKK